ncbi:Zn(II)2Cys6 transcription factor [Aspergillus nomiae NRRL 13137]|uniref:Zn(II)2Cys6 transcription factor n=1 Tax=Aspergillus nomiae NRRL (strain ATCC 15546 / NRRL 13137 / CBS 260.88 / M93) TaxID=1509407 RepID=A0A0L1JIN3_ASPN3|nr:Zn(II)2Cys6 transcription factor [Aspergillus nomiae NRRL 13137]KNG91606.1 Zn(II)2Cys6 transcription factor [Aspergillus nomiae NRRL 13137]
MLSRNRTLTGCGTCRHRHVKCDEASPVCDNCQQQGLACLGYERQLVWAKANQLRMTQLMKESLGKQSASATLAQLENEYESGVRLEGDSFRGPFGVLVLSTNAFADNNQAEPPSDEPDRDRLEWDVFWPTITGDTTIFDGPHNVPGGSCDLIIPDPFLDIDAVTSDAQSLLRPFMDPHSDEFTYQSPSSSLAPVFPSFEVSSGRPTIPPEAADLLRYFKENVISLLFSLRNCRYCPWQTVHFPGAMSAFADLSIHHTTSHTRLSLFYSLLAASCLHKYTRDHSAGDLHISAKRFKETAKQHLELALHQEVVGSKQVKYKEILMAVLSMVMLAVFNGENTSAQAFLIDAEYIIRIRGLPKPHKSLKVRSLHHVYTFLRIMAESTCGCALLDICPDRPSASLLSIEPSPNSLRSFRVADDILGAELDITLVKGNLIGHNDIHLEVMGQWNDTLFPDMYGIPESLMNLVSQVIRLANEQELLHRGGPTVDARTTKELKRRASMLEQYILSWKQSPESKPINPTAMKNGQDTTISQNLTANHFMIQAMHQAIILFYYRRVSNISAVILQDTVRNCLEFLKRYDKTRIEDSESAPPGTPDTAILWPGFVAACEALDPELQSSLLEWLIMTGHRTSLGPFSAAAGTAQCVWKTRSETQDYTLSWFDVMKHERCPIVAT